MEITVLAAGMCGVGVGRASGGKSEEGWRALWELVSGPVQGGGAGGDSRSWVSIHARLKG